MVSQTAAHRNHLDNYQEPDTVGFMRVIIIGGGIGGLALAHGLRRRGVDVRVAERDTHPECTGGHRLRITGEACGALRELLPPDDLDAVYAISAVGHRRDVAVVDHRGREILAGRVGDPEAIDVDRISLRAVLAYSLSDVIDYGTTYTGHTVDDEGQVTAEFDDGSRRQADVLVGADGANSAVATRLASGTVARGVGLSGIAGRTPARALDTTGLAVDPAGPLLAIGPGGVGAFLALHDPARCHAAVPASRTVNGVDTQPNPFLVWGLIATDSIVEGWRNDGGGAHAAAQLLADRGWSRSVIDSVAAADESTVTAYRMSAADPDALAPWASGTVTAIGDAVHVMPPTGGLGASTALRDAAVLNAELGAAEEGRFTVPMALHRYENRMRTYAAPAVRESLGPVRWIRRSAGPLGSPVSAVALSAAANLAALRRRMVGEAS